ncbi:peptidase T [Raoultella terrigena]|uniref:Peptidase T n=1 Tax=Raoultella terrigena TaxID=577 RepID=A0A7Z9CTN0_RAOTE|nr:peptidase T [Raoultella terrigena]
MDKLLERFLQYVSLDTQSKAGVRQVPSTEGQWKLLRLLQAQLEEMGLVNVTLSEKGTVMGTLAANVAGIFRPLALSPTSIPRLTSAASTSARKLSKTTAAAISPSASATRCSRR